MRAGACRRLFHRGGPCQELDAAPIATQGALVRMERLRRLRWGVLSTAAIARRKVIPGIQGADTARSSPSPRATSPGRAVAAELAIPSAHGSYEALLADPDVDAVYIPLPNHLHAAWTIAAAGPASTSCARSRWR